MIEYSEIKTRAKKYLDSPIDQICGNNFHSYNENHCAHFISHLAGLNFEFSCKSYKGGNKEGANIRVQEIFSKCPKVGLFKDLDFDFPVLVFITNKSNVDLQKKKMANVPKKHIGIYIDDQIYHYSNSLEKVVRWSPDKFKSTFQRTYGGDQELFYGLIPGSDLLMNIDVEGTRIKKGLAFELSLKDNKWFATNLDDKKEFYVGTEIKQAAKGNFGIYQKTSEYYGVQYKADDFYDKIDHWAVLLEATGYCESNNYFNLVNTYDRAKFTFGFYQLAAHTPNDNLILLFKELSFLNEFKKYFPELTLIDGKLHRFDKADNSYSNLEKVFTDDRGRKNLQFFMNYLNPIRKKIDEQEILHSARLIHWANNSDAMREKQVMVANEILQSKMKIYDRWYDLDGQSDTVCSIIADIHHQGRGKKTSVKDALHSANPEHNLININPNYKSRSKNLKFIIDKLTFEGKLGSKTYSSALNEFK